MASNINRVLVPVDFSDHSLAAAKLALSIARAQGAEMALFHAVRRVDHISIPAGVAEEMRKDAIRQCERQLEKLAGELSEQLGTPIDAEVRYAEPARAILGFATEWQADLIALGSHGADSLDRGWLGSIVARVAREARCPVLSTTKDQLARFPEGGKFGHVLVAIDYSKFSQPAAQLAVQLAEAGKLIEMIHIYYAPEQALAEARAEELQKLEKFASQIDLAPVEVSLKAEVGRVADQLVDYAEGSKTDVIIVGAHGRDAATTYLGSVADRVLRSSPVPVILLPDTD